MCKLPVPKRSQAAISLCPDEAQCQERWHLRYRYWHPCPREGMVSRADDSVCLKTGVAGAFVYGTGRYSAREKSDVVLSGP
jgi:hypothetical protein